MTRVWDKGVTDIFGFFRTGAAAENKKIRKRGFTLAEIIAALVVASIVAGVSVPVVVNLFGEFRQKRLYANAETIYITSQNYMTMMEAQGQLDHLRSQLKSRASFPEGEPFAVGCPADAAEKDRIYYIAHNDVTGLSCGYDSFSSVEKMLCPPSSFNAEITAGYYVVEFSLALACVTGVFFSDRTFDYSTVGQKRGSSDWLKEHDIGYCGGGGDAFFVTKVRKQMYFS